MARDWKKEHEERRQEEIEAGKKAVAIYGKLEKVDTETRKLRAAFPTLSVDAVLNKPYDYVTVRARPQFLAPMTSMGVLTENYSSKEEMIFEDPIDGYPTDHLVAQLALIS